MGAEDTFLEQIKKRAAKPHASLWFENPESWVWTTGDGRVQGMGLLVQHDPGLANLLWLACDLHAVPTTYELRLNPLTGLLIAYGRSMTLGGLPIYDQAASLSMVQFLELLKVGVFSAPPPVHNLAPLLILLINGRLGHA